MKTCIRKSSHLFKFNRINSFVGITAITLFIIISICFINKLTSDAHESVETYKYFTCISVEKNDTLWSIADEYITDEYNDKDDYILEVCLLNHIQPDDKLVTGQNIVVPYYSSEYMD